MARAGNTEHSVHQAANELLAKGIKPTVRSVQSRIGGGNELIVKYMQTWRARYETASEQSNACPVEIAVSSVYDAVEKELTEKLNDHAQGNDKILKDTEQLLTVAEERMERLLDRCVDLENRNTELSHNNAGLLNKTEQLESKLELIQKDVVRINQEHADTTRANSILSSQISEKATALQQAADTNTRLATQIENAEAAHKAELKVYAEIATKDKEQIAKLQGTLDEQNARMAELKSQLVSMNRQLDATQKQFSSRDKEAELSNLSYLKTHDQLTEAKATIISLREKLHEERQVSLTSDSAILEEIKEKMLALEKKMDASSKQPKKKKVQK